MSDILEQRTDQTNFYSILSIHIPKTAGHTFRYLLEQAYGKPQVLHVNQGWLSKHNKTIQGLHPERYQVLHGHLPYQRYLAPFHTPGTKVITFLRDPVERVLSNFRYYRRMKDKRLSMGKPIKHYYDLDTFIELKERQNVMTRFLEGINLEDLFFVGFQEQFRSDTAQLAEKLNWHLPKEAFRTRKNPTAPTDEVSEGVQERIAALNSADLELYDRAQALKKDGYWK